MARIEERPREMFARRPAQLRNRGHVSLPQRPPWRTPPGATRPNNVSWLKYPVKRAGAGPEPGDCAPSLLNRLQNAHK
jgi:hypothetical protein